MATISPWRSIKLLLPLRLRAAGQELSYITTLATLGTPLDATFQELRIECYFPADDATRTFAQQM